MSWPAYLPLFVPPTNWLPGGGPARRCEHLEAADPRHSLIAAHLTYYTSGRQFSLIDLPTIRRWRPDCIITLVDDMLDIHSALSRRDADRHTNFRLRLREILAWLAAEIAMADLLSVISSRSGPSRTTSSASNTPPRCSTASFFAAGSILWSIPVFPSRPYATTPICGLPSTGFAANCIAASSSLTR